MQTDKSLTIENARYIVFTLVNNSYEISFSNSGTLHDYPNGVLVHGVRKSTPFYFANYAKSHWDHLTDQQVIETYPGAFSTLLLLGIPHVPN